MMMSGPLQTNTARIPRTPNVFHRNMRRTPLPPAFVAALPRLQAELSIALSEAAELPANERLGHIGRKLLQHAADETPPTDTSNGPVPVIEDAQLKRIKIAFEDAVEAAIYMPGNVRANVGALLIGRAVKYERSIGKRV